MKVIPPAPDAEKAWALALKAAPLADGFLSLIHVLTLQARTDLSPERRQLAGLRLAELQRRLFPDMAIATLDKLGEVTADLEPWPQLHPAAVRAAALLEAGRADEASFVLPEVPKDSGVRDLLLGRMSFEGGRLAEAQGRFERAAAGAAESPLALAAETEIEALSYAARLRHLQGDPLDEVLAAFDAVEHRCEAVGAGLTQSLHRVYAQVVREGRISDLTDAFIKLAHTQVKASYCQGHMAKAAELAPVPVAVHGAATRHADDPSAYVSAILSLSSLAWRAGYAVEGFEVATYGLAIGRRVHGDAAVVDLQLYMDGLAEAIPAERWAEVQAKALARAKAAREE
ncbi:MAG: hypothetical protein H6739_11090 [Alphaproteobacteria bacterium]|nr:hypothetical protein [Alphaproteobacteria bacterium]